MQTAFQPGAFQTSGFQIVAATATASGGWLEGAWRLGQRPTLKLKPKRRRRRRTPAEEQIARLEQHIAEARNTTPAVVRLEADTRKRALPPQVLQAVQRALNEQTARAIRDAYAALERVEREDEEFAVLLTLALH